MNKVGRTLASAATTIGVVLVATGCSSNLIGADGPQPDIAARVGDATIKLDDLTSAVNGLCVLQSADPSAAATSREYAQGQILQGWVTALVDAAYAEDNDLDITPPDSGLEQALGWEDVDEDDQHGLRAYVDAFVYSSAVQQSGLDEAPDPADYDITINPRFDIKLDGDSFVPAGDQLSVPVSKEAATNSEAPTPEMLQDLPDDELCGKRPAPDATPPGLPVPQG